MVGPFYHLPRQRTLPELFSRQQSPLDHPPPRMGGGDISKGVTELPVNARTFNVIPGVQMLFDWPLSKAVEIDRKQGIWPKRSPELLTRAYRFAATSCWRYRQHDELRL
jgi:hypothetical protein